MGRRPRAAPEEPRKVIGTHVDNGREVGEPHGFVEILPDVLAHAPHSPRRGLPDVGRGRQDPAATGIAVDDPTKVG